MPDTRFYRKLAMLSTMGVSFTVASAGGFVLGNWLDGKLGMRPWLTIGLGLLGVAAAFVQLYRTVTEAERLGGDGNGGGE